MLQSAEKVMCALFVLDAYQRSLGVGCHGTLYSICSGKAKATTSENESAFGTSNAWPVLDAHEPSSLLVDT